jgi:hypothetical protein
VGLSEKKKIRGTGYEKNLKIHFFSGGPKIEEKQSDTTKIKVSKLGW